MAWLLVAMLLAAACSADRDDELVVFAAASLTDAFSELAAAFEADHDHTITLQFAGSQVLSRQLAEGAPADVFAAADTTTMQRVVDERGVAGPPEIFTTNALALVTPTGNPGGVAGFDDLADSDLAIALCAIEVPCGAASAIVLAELTIEPATDTHEASVRSTLSKIALGEADAALVYRSDVVSAADRVSAVTLTSEEQAAIEAGRQAYPIAVVSPVVGSGSDRGADTTPARSFVQFVLSADGQRILDTHGFGR